MPIKIIIIALAAMLAGAGWLLAQPESTPPACDPAYLARRRAELTASLDVFPQAVESDSQAALERLFLVGAAYQELALECGYIPPDIATRFVGADVPRILTLLDEVSGDPLNGQLLYNSDTLACYGCHVAQAGEAAPALDGTLTRVEETRLADPALEGYTVTQYLVESIIQPGHYVTPGYNNVMPNNFGDRLTLQDLADLLIFLESQDAPSP
ncbi:MAG: hypothetical protein HXY41_14175 [Chloroflexi bacterium]|nr:hypothetical protein [Chloroflexota bacterium]